ncbi:MAG: FecR domain-containing protein, partial [Pseudobdellovibrionaceae bacterium]|nr:FecR domain-containing protein [Pseudobdellovibrionaceae bacterium]
MPRSMLMIWLLAMTLSVAWIVWPNQVEYKQGALANVASIQGNVHIRPAGSFTWTSARVGSHLLALDAIATGANSRAELQLENGDTIVLPEDTQIKVQAQTVIPGMTISLIKGGLEIQTEDIRDIDKKVEAVKEKRKPAAKPITIQTNRYSVDLSRLEGQFRLQANAGAEASKPETVRVQNAKGAISLARLDDSDSATVDQQLDDSIQEAPLPAPIEVLPDVVAEPVPLPVPPVKKMVQVPVPEPEPEVMVITPEPDVLPLVKEPPEELVLPRLKDSQLSFWSVESIEESLEIPLVLPLGQPKAVFNPARWQTILRVSVRGSKKSVVVKREPGSLGIFFYLRELQSILPQKDLDGLSLIVESGLVR